MGVVIAALVAVAALAGLVIGGRHLYFRLSRPHGFECSLRLVRGEMPGLTTRFRAGHAGPEMKLLRWRRIAWPGPGVTFPATFTVVPVELDSGTLLELALPARRLPRLVALLS
jgi:hypothetical protein